MRAHGIVHCGQQGQGINCGARSYFHQTSVEQTILEKENGRDREMSIQNT